MLPLELIKQKNGFFVSNLFKVLNYVRRSDVYPVITTTKKEYKKPAFFINIFLNPESMLLIINMY